MTELTKEMFEQKLSIEGPNIVAREWSIDVVKPRVYLTGFQYQFNSKLIKTVQRQYKQVAEAMLRSEGI